MIAEPAVATHDSAAALCRTLAEAGILAWSCDGDGRVVADGDVGAVLGAWGRSEGMSDLRRRLITGIPRAGGGPAIELFSGCQILPLRQSSAAASRPTVALLMSAEGIASPIFTEICEASDLCPREVGAALAPFIRSGDVELGQAAAAARYIANAHLRSVRDQRTLDQFSEELSRSYEELNLSFRITRHLNSSEGPDETLRRISEQMQQHLPFSWLGIQFRGSGDESSGIEGKMFSSGTLPCDLAGLQDAADRFAAGLPSEAGARVLRVGTDEIANLAGSDVVAQPICRAGVLAGVVLAGDKNGVNDEVAGAELQFLGTIGEFLGVYYANECRFAGQKALFLGMLKAITATIDAKDSYTRGHSHRVALLAAGLAAQLGKDAATVERYHTAGLLHDVGKIGVPGAVLTKPGRLTDEEFAIIKQHPVIGHGILRSIPRIADLLPAVLHHHEKFDGTGYPDGLSGAAIPEIARIMALADTFDAMSSNRAYRKALPREHILAEITAQAGRQFDPALAEAFVTLDFGPFDRALAEFSG